MRRRTALGVALLLAVGLAGRGLAEVTPFTPLVAAILVGAVLGNTVGVPAPLRRGVATHGLWLETGIVLLGASIAVDRVLAAGPFLVGLVVAVVAATLLVVEGLASLSGLPEELGSLLAAGASICGVSAVASVAGAIDARESHVAYASATVLVFDAVTVFAYPAVGSLLGLSDFVYGVWAGTTMFSTGPVTAAGFAYSAAAGRWAVLTKLTRNALIGVVAVAYAAWYARRGAGAEEAGESASRDQAGATVGAAADRSILAVLLDGVPTFFVGFLVLLLLGNTVLSADALAALDHATNWLFLLAFAGLGLELDVDVFRESGLAPVAVVLTSLIGFSLGVLGLLLAV